MQSVFEVKLGECTDNDSEYTEEKTYTCLAKDAEAAIAKVKKQRLGFKFKWTDDDEDPPKERTAKITAVTVLGVSHICDVDF